ncbi:MAG: oligosaccharide flippase family protein [Pseudomonadota bacterium]
MNKNEQQRKKHINQASLLYSFTLLGVALGFIVSIVNTHFLSVEDYGVLKFIQQLFAFFSVAVSFGYSYSIGRMMTHDDNKNEHGGLIGTGILINLAIALITAMVIFIGLLFSSGLLDEKAKTYLIIFLPFIIIQIFELYLSKLLQGSNRIHSLSFFSVLPRVLYLLITGILIYLSWFNLFASMLVFYLISSILILAYFYSLKPSFQKISKHFKNISVENKVNGFPIYVGTLANVATAQSLGVLVGIYVSMESVAFFSLAVVVSGPLQMLPSVIGTTMFKSFAKQDKIPKKVLLASTVLSLISLIGFWLIIEFVLVLAYSERYLQVSPYAKIMAVGMICHGMGDLFNRFIGAHGKGLMLRNGAFISGAVLIISCIILMPFYGALGAIWSKTLSSIVYLFAMMFYYKKLLNTTIN